MPESWMERYLARIGYDGSREPSLATLRALQERHLLSVPFENLDIHWKRPIVVDEERFIEKIVAARRGGFCYELNGAFAALLRAFGFEVTLLSARVHDAGGTFGPPFDHMTLLVRLGEDSRWLADVGFGESFLQPLNLDARLEQHDATGVYRIVPGQEWQMQLRREELWEPQFAFTLEPHELPEYAAMCDFQQTSPESHFTKGRVCSLATETGRVTLTETTLIITRDGERTEIPVAADEWNEVLRETFGIA